MTTTDLEITPGSTGDWLITVTDAAGAAQDLSALSAAWLTVKRSLAVADPGIFQLTLGAGLAVVSAAAGTIQVTATPAQTALMADGTGYRWDCRLKFVDGTVSNPDGLSGAITTGRRVTQSN